MSEVNESRPSYDWFAGGAGPPRSYNYTSAASAASSSSAAAAAAKKEKVEGEEDWKFHAVEFAKGFAEMSVQFGKGVRDVVRQTIVREDSVIVKKLRGPCGTVCGKLSFLNEYLPEDRDPVHSWTAILFVALLAFTGIAVFFFFSFSGLVF